MDNIEYIDDETVSKFLCLFMKLSLVVSKTSSEAVKNIEKNWKLDFEEIKKIYENKNDNIDENIFGNNIFDTKYTCDAKDFSDDLEETDIELSEKNREYIVKILSKTVKDMLHNEDKFHTLIRDAENNELVERYDKETFILLWKSMIIEFSDMILNSISTAISVSIRNYVSLSEIYNLPSAYDSFIPLSEYDPSNINDYISEFEKRTSSDRRDIEIRKENEKIRIAFLMQLLANLSKLNGEQLTNLFSRFYFSSIKFIETNWDKIHSNFRYLLEKYYNRPSFYVLDIYNSFMLHLIIYTIYNFSLKEIEKTGDTSKSIKEKNTEIIKSFDFMKNTKINYN